MNIFNTVDIGTGMVPIPKLDVLQVCHFVAHVHWMKHGARKNLKSEKFQVEMILYIFISQLQIPDLISISFHNNYVVQEFQFISRIN